MPAAVVADGRLLVLGEGVEQGEHLLERLAVPLGAVERLVQVVDVGLVVLVVVDLASSARRSSARARRSRTEAGAARRASVSPFLGSRSCRGYAPRRTGNVDRARRAMALAYNHDEITARELKPALLRARRHLARDDRGALQALPGLRREAERDPRQARGGRPRRRQPDLLRAARAQGRAVVRDRRDQEPRDLLRAPRRHRRRPGRPLRRPREARLRLGRRVEGRSEGDRASPVAAGRGRPTTGTRAASSTTSATRRTPSPIWNATPLVALDVYEHAYFLDFATDRASYIDKFFDNLDYDVVNDWAQRAGIRP